MEGSQWLGALEVGNPLKALLVVFLLREGVGKTIAAAHTIARAVLETESGRELLIYAGARKDFVNSGEFPTENDMQKAFEIWIKNCKHAHNELKTTGLQALQMSSPIGLVGLPESEDNGWKKALETSGWILELVRARLVHGAEKIVAEPRIIIGDSTAEQLHHQMDRTALIHQNSIAGVIRAISTCVLSTKVKGALIILGKDSLQAGETVDSILDQFRRLVQFFRPYSHLKICWAPPPYCHKREAEHCALVMGLQALLADSNIQFIATTSTGRSMLEIFRFGSTFNAATVNINGWLTELGIKTLIAWIYTQTSFPGDRTLGIRTLHSRVVVPARQERVVPIRDRLSFPRHSQSADSAGYRRVRSRSPIRRRSPRRDQRR